MLLLLPPALYDPHYVFFTEPVKNNIFDNSLFVRIVYSPSNVVCNGLLVSLKDSSYDDLIRIEKSILGKYKTNKSAKQVFPEIFAFKPVLPQGGYLKISGVWETAVNIGIAYKFAYPSER